MEKIYIWAKSWHLFEIKVTGHFLITIYLYLILTINMICTIFTEICLVNLGIKFKANQKYAK